MGAIVLIIILLSFPLLGEEHSNLFFFSPKTANSLGVFAVGREGAKTKGGILANGFVNPYSGYSIFLHSSLFKTDYLKTTHSLLGTETKEQSRIGYQGLLGVSAYFLKLYAGKYFSDANYLAYGGGIQVFNEKSIHLIILESAEKNYRETSVSFLSGDQISVGLEIAKVKEKGEDSYRGGISLLIRTSILDSGISGLSKDGELKKSEGIGFISKRFSEASIFTLSKEIYPYLPELDPKIKKPIHEKRIRFPFIPGRRKEQIVHKLEIQELLNFKIPLNEAIKISKSSEDSLKYKSLLNSLPKDTQRKCYVLQKKKEEEEN